jgi:hypothetical protein
MPQGHAERNLRVLMAGEALRGVISTIALCVADLAVDKT